MLEDRFDKWTGSHVLAQFILAAWSCSASMLEKSF